MRKLHFPRLLNKLFNKNKAVWMLTFVLSFAFFTLSFSSPTVRAVKEDSAGAIYLIHPDQNGNQEGFMPNLYNSIYRSLTGYDTATDVSSGGTVIFERKGGVVTALADIGDSFYENPSGSALIWAQDQINMIAGKGSFKALAYNPNDTDIYYVSGYTALEGTIGLWNWSRNIVYSLFIIILIGVAFMILFRRSLGGQQYVTLTNSLPSIILSLVLITFSYPISAVFIDMVSIGCNLVYNVIIAAPNAPGHAFLEQIPDQSGTPQNIQVPKAVEGKITSEVKVSGTPQTVENDGIDITGQTDVKNVLQPDDPQMSIWAIFYTSNAKVCGGMKLGILTVTPEAGEKCDFSKFLLPAAVYGPFSLTINSLLWALDNLGLGNLIIEIALILLIITTQFKLLKQIIGDYLILSFFPIFAPWIFLVAAMPNRTSKMITDYVKILGLSVFNLVVIYACFLILVVMGYSSNDGTDVTGAYNNQKFQLGDSFRQMAQIKWVPPMLGYSYGQIVGNTGTGAAGAKIITTIIIIFFYMAIPRVPEELRSWLSIPQIPAILRNTGQDVGNTFKQAGGYIAGGIGSLTRRRLSKE